MADLLPHNATPQERALSEATARIGDVPVRLRDVWNPETCPLDLLPWLAWALSVDDWDAAWSEDQKRGTIAAAIKVQQLKGTVGAVKGALSAAGYGNAEVVEGFGADFYDASVFHDGSILHSAPDHWAEYRVILARPITVEQAANVRAILLNVAPARSHLKALDFTEALNINDARLKHDGQFTHGVA